jgi:predicted acylesterase/phospholipase RssA
MLAVEAQLLQGKALSSADPRELNRQRNALDICALCLSGGGIRSASFALGVLQALAARSRSDCKKVSTSADDALLTDVAYLSTVSGGGYIGSWLTAWIAREQSFAAVWPKLIARQRG